MTGNSFLEATEIVLCHYNFKKKMYFLFLIKGFAKSKYSQFEDKSTSFIECKNSDNCHRKVSRSPGADGSLSMKILIKNELKDSSEDGCGSKQDVHQYLVTNVNTMVKEEPMDVSIMNNNNESDKYERHSCSQEIDPTMPLVAVKNMVHSFFFYKKNLIRN